MLECIRHRSLECHRLAFGLCCFVSFLPESPDTKFFFIGMTLWTSVGKRPSEVGQPPTERSAAEHEQPTRQGASS